MKRFYLYCPLILLILSGCALFRNPSKKWDKAVASAAQTEKKIATNNADIVEEGKGYVYGTKLALEADSSTNRAHTVATLLNEKALVTLGSPTMADANYLHLMVANLLSTNQALILRGEKQLAEKDAKVVEYQTLAETLQLKLDKAEQRILDIGTVNAAYASKWTTLVKIGWYIIYFLIAGFVIKVLAAVLPPPYNSIISILAIPLSIFVRCIHAFVPEAKKAAGLVAEKTYTDTKLALSHVVEAVENFKQKAPASGEQLGEMLKDETSKEVTRPIITEVKKEMGYV